MQNRKGVLQTRHPRRPKLQIRLCNSRAVPRHACAQPSVPIWRYSCEPVSISCWTFRPTHQRRELGLDQWSSAQKRATYCISSTFPTRSAGHAWLSETRVALMNIRLARPISNYSTAMLCPQHRLRVSTSWFTPLNRKIRETNTNHRNGSKTVISRLWPEWVESGH